MQSRMYVDRHLSLDLGSRPRTCLCQIFRFLLEVRLNINVIEDDFASLCGCCALLFQISRLAFRGPYYPPSVGNSQDAKSTKAHCYRERRGVSRGVLRPKDLRADNGSNLTQRIAERNCKGRPGSPCGRLKPPWPHGREPGQGSGSSNYRGRVHTSDIRIGIYRGVACQGGDHISEGYHRIRHVLAVCQVTAYRNQEHWQNRRWNGEELTFGNRAASENVSVLRRFLRMKQILTRDLN